MKKLNRLLAFTCLLFAVSACGGNGELEEEDDTEEGENAGYVGDKDKNNNTTPPTPNPEPEEPQENPIFQTDSGKAYKKLLSLANEQLISKKSLSANTEYVSGIVSLEYTASKVAFCALGNKQENTNYLVKVSMDYAFSTAEDFVTTMMGIDAKTASTTFSVSSEVMNIYGEPQVNNKFHELKSTKVPQFDESQVNAQCCYRADNSETNYFAFTYIGTDSKVHSINEIVLNIETSELTIANEYKVAASESEKMGKLFDIILENY